MKNGPNSSKDDNKGAGTGSKKAKRYYVGKVFHYIKDITNGPYKTINEAIQAAEPGGIILVSQGRYMESLVITLISL